MRRRAAKVGLAAHDFSDVRGIYRRFDIADIGKALSAQQLLGDVQGGNAEATLLKANGRRFEGSLRSFRPASAAQAGGAGGRDAAQEGASVCISAIASLPARLGLQLAFDELGAMRFEPLVNAFLVHPHQTPVAHHIGGKAADTGRAPSERSVLTRIYPQILQGSTPT